MSRIERILITRPEGSYPQLSHWCESHGLTLIYQPFIRTQSRPKQPLPDTDWIFFSSPRGVRHFFEHYTIRSARVAALSVGTAKALKEYGVDCSFTGSADVSPATIGATFSEILNPNEAVLFPISQRSKRTVIQQLPPNQVETVITYETLFMEQISLLHDPELILFTSPSNFEGFLKHFKDDGEEKWVAFGETTAASIRQLKPNRNFDILAQSTAYAFIDYLAPHIRKG